MERDPWGPHTRLALTDPVRARSELRTALDRSDSDRERAAIGQGLGVALRTLGDADESRQVLEIAVDDARIAGDPELTAELELTLSGSMATSGDPEGAIRLAEKARDTLDGPAKA